MATVRATNATESTALIVASIATLEGQINGVKAVMDGLKSTMDDVKSIVKGEKTTMIGMMTAVDGVKTAAAKASRAANAAIDRADDTDADVTLINNTIGEIRDEVNHDYSRLQSLDNEVLEVGNNVKDMESTVEDHEAQIEDLNDQIQTLQAELDALRPVTGVVRTLCVMLRVSYDVVSCIYMNTTHSVTNNNVAHGCGSCSGWRQCLGRHQRGGCEGAGVVIAWFARDSSLCIRQALVEGRTVHCL